MALEIVQHCLNLRRYFESLLKEPPQLELAPLLYSSNFGNKSCAIYSKHRRKDRRKLNYRRYFDHIIKLTNTVGA
jgi:hypothetical protein